MYTYIYALPAAPISRSSHHHHRIHVHTCLSAAISFAVSGPDSGSRLGPGSGPVPQLLP